MAVYGKKIIGYLALNIVPSQNHSGPREEWGSKENSTRSTVAFCC